MKLRWVTVPMTWKEPPAKSKQGEGRDVPAEHGSMNTQDLAESADSDSRQTRAILGLNKQVPLLNKTPSLCGSAC